MKTIDLKEFTENFIKISSTLTIAEIQMLYLFITEPSMINLSQQNIADRIGSDRRTVNIGVKKLKQKGYVSDMNIASEQLRDSDNNITHVEKDDSDKNITHTEKDDSDKNIALYEKEKAKKYIHIQQKNISML